jgi:DNA-binding NarL/FixJ family response regulator
MATVLVVDDDFGVLSYAKRVLKGHNIHVASDIETAMVCVYTKEPDVVILDVGLPDGNGLDAVGVLRSICPRSAVIVVTSDTDSSLRDAAFSRGAHAYAQKIDLPALPRIVDRVLSAVRHRRWPTRR